MQGSKSSFFSKSSTRTRFDDDNWGGFGKNKKNSDQNKQARRQAYRQEKSKNNNSQ
jgi:hypothetical protein